MGKYLCPPCPLYWNMPPLVLEKHFAPPNSHFWKNFSPPPLYLGGGGHYEKLTKKAKKSKNQKFLRPFLRNYLFTSLVQILGPEDDLVLSYFNF